MTELLVFLGVAATLAAAVSARGMIRAWLRDLSGNQP